MKKVMFVNFRRSDFSHQQCLTEWTGEPHMTFTRAIPGAKKFVQNSVEVEPEMGQPNGIGEMWFDNDEDLEYALNSPEMAAAVEDAKRFLDMEKTYALIVDEQLAISRD